MDKKAGPIYMLLTRNSPQTQRHAQSQGMEKHISGKQKREESRGCSTTIRQNRLQNKESNKRQRRILHNDKGLSPTRVYNHYKYIYAPNTGAPTYVKQILTELKEEIECNAFILGDLNTPLTLKDRSTRQKINKETEPLNTR